MTTGHGQSPFEATAFEYHKQGWNPLPLWSTNPDIPFDEKARQKSSPPKGYTGRNGADPTKSDIDRWISEGRYHNIAVRMPAGVIGIDVDAYHGGLDTLAKLVEECGPLPETVMSTSRDDGSGIRFFRVNETLTFIEGLDGIEIIQRHHRYAVVWPSMHPDIKARYRWYDTATGKRHRNAEAPRLLDNIPDIGSLPALPETWVERLQDKRGTGNVAKRTLSRGEFAALRRNWATTGGMCSHMRNVLGGLSGGRGSRHDECRNAQLTIVRLGEAGHPGADEALDHLRDWFEATAGADRRIDGEWERGLEGAYGIVAASPTPEHRKGCMDIVSETKDVIPFPRGRRADGSAPVRGAEDGRPEDAPAPVELNSDDSGSDDDAGRDDSGQDDPIVTGVGRDGRPRVNVSNKERAARWLREEMGRGGLSGLFVREGELVYTPRVNESGYVPAREGEDDGPAKVRIMDAIDLKTAVEIRYSPGVLRTRTVTETDPETGKEIPRTVTEWDPKLFPTESATNAYRSARFGIEAPNLRTLKGVTHTPIVRADGSILATPGYDPATKLLYLPPSDLDVPAVSDQPSEIEVRRAVQLITSIVEEFPFVADFHRANWFGALFTPIMRAMLAPPYPVFIMDAPSPGSGKSYLASILRTVHGGILRAGFPEDDTEFAKAALGILVDTTAPVVTFDNVRGKVKSAKFEALLTTSQFSSRLLGANREATAPNDRLWTITANNADIDGDLARRAYWVTIDPRMPRPQDRTGFKLNLKKWVPENRGRIIHALLTIVRAWVLAGMPKAEWKRSDDYAEWDSSIEGLLSWAGFPGQFGTADPKHLESDEDAEWAAFLTAAYEVLGSGTWKLSDLVERIGDPHDPYDGSNPFRDAAPEKINPATLPGDLADKWSKVGGSRAGFTKSLGKWMKYRVGRYVGDLVLMMASNDPKRGHSYRIANYRDEQATA